MKTPPVFPTTNYKTSMPSPHDRNCPIKPESLQLSDQVLARRVFRADMNAHLQANTILSKLAPYLDKEKITLDIGGAAGHMTYFFSPHSKHVHSFEAVPPVYTQLEKMEIMCPNVTAYNLAMSDYSGPATIYVDDKRLSNSGFLNLVDGPSIDVQAEFVDNLFLPPPRTDPVTSADLDLPMLVTETIGFIKIDVEGTEIDVLHGARAILGEQRPNLMVEIYKPYSACPLDAIFKYLMEPPFKYKCAYYNPKLQELVQVKDVQDGLNAVLNLHHLHDGDFLFYG